MRIFSLKGVSGILLGAFVLLSLSTIGLSQAKSGSSDAKKLTNPIKSSPEAIAAGQKLYQTNCKVCHGDSGKGDGPAAGSMTVKPADLTAAKLAHGSSDGEIFSNIKDGIPPDMKMKSFKAKLSDQDIWNVVIYVHSLKK